MTLLEEDGTMTNIMMSSDTEVGSSVTSITAASA